MPWLRRWSVLALFVALSPLLLVPSRGQAPPADDKAGTKWLLDRTLTVSPQPAPVPALKYRLFPLHAERKEGNAAPIYMRFAHERNDATKRRLQEKTEQWSELPPDKLPLAEAREFLKGWQYNLRQLELGARRKTADWNYTFDAGNPVNMLLPDVQEMRMHVRLLVLKARVEIAEDRHADAIRTLETGFSFSQQLAEAPLLISALVGIASASQLADCLPDLMERPGAPNLYWAVTAMPRPLIDLRPALEFEQRLQELQFPDLADLDRPRSPAEWDATLRRVRTEMVRVANLTDPKAFKEPRPGTAATDPAAKSPDLPAAKQYLNRTVGLTAAAVDAMPPAQVLLLYLANSYKELSDERFKVTYLPYPQARPLLAEMDRKFQALPDTEAKWLAQLFLPAVGKVGLAQTRIERRLAALRVIEALRLHAAAHGGKLPAKLADVTVVPVPDDPGTGQPFEYHLDGQTATLTGRIPDESLAVAGLRYRVTVRK